MREACAAAVCTTHLSAYLCCCQSSHMCIKAKAGVAISVCISMYSCVAAEGLSVSASTQRFYSMKCKADKAAAGFVDQPVACMEHALWCV